MWTRYAFKMIVNGDKNNCERFCNFLENGSCEFTTKKKISEGKEYPMYFEGYFYDEDNLWDKTFHSNNKKVHVITEEEYETEQLRRKDWGLCFSLLDYSLYFNVDIYINGIDYPEQPIYRHFNNGVWEDDKMPNIINLDKEAAINEECYQNTLEAQRAAAIDPEEIFGEDFYNYSDPEDHDGFC